MKIRIKTVEELTATPNVKDEGYRLVCEGDNTSIVPDMRRYLGRELDAKQGEGIHSECCIAEGWCWRPWMIADSPSPTPTRDYQAEAKEIVVKEMMRKGHFYDHQMLAVELQAALLRLQDENTSLRKKGEWIPFSPDDNATWPEANHWYWVCRDLSQAEGYFFLGSWKVNGEIVDDVIAYQPLPPFPAQLMQGKKE